MDFNRDETDPAQAPDFSQWPYTAPDMPRGRDGQDGRGGRGRQDGEGAPSTGGLPRAVKIIYAVLASVLLATAAFTAVFFVVGPSYWVPDPKPERPLTAEWVFGADSVVEGKDVTFALTASSAHQGTEACAAGATDPQAAQALRAAKCQARVEGALTTTDGLVKASVHLLQFPDEASAQQAALGLKYTRLKFLQQGRPTDGMVAQDGRFVAVTSVTAEPKHKRKARTALTELSAIFV